MLHEFKFNTHFYTNLPIIIDVPIPGIAYPVVYAVIELPLDLKATQFGDTVLWGPGTSLNSRTSYNPIFTGPSEQLYSIEIKTFGGCVTVDTQLVKLVDKAVIYVPNAFTLNGDGLNDILRLILFGIKRLHYFKIFNRLGQQLFETSSPGVGWNGTMQGTPLSTQIVVWLAEGLGVDNKIYRLKGSSLLAR